MPLFGGAVAFLARLFQLVIARRLYLLVAASQHIHGRHITDGAMQAHIVVVIDALLNQPFGPAATAV
jgi:hypothetical protein